MKPGPSYRLENSPHCPACGHLLDGTFCMDGDRTPTPGDWTICGECVQPLIFTEGLALRRATNADVKLMLAKNADVSPGTREQLRIAVSAVFTFLIEDLRHFEGIPDTKNPAGEVEKIRSPKRIPKALDVSEIPRIMAAGPALLEALKQILGWRELRSGADEFPIARIEAVARAAIAKATGETP